jgi:hypothetical protein
VESLITTKSKSSEPSPAYSHDQLMKALYWIWDAFDRALINGFCVYETAESILGQKDMKGDAIRMGVRKLDWISGSKPIFDAFVGSPVVEEEKYCVYHYENIPVVVHIFEEDECIRSVNTVMYKREYFKLPNPYSRFLELYGNSNN